MRHVRHWWFASGAVNIGDSSVRGNILVAEGAAVDDALFFVQWFCFSRGNPYGMAGNISPAKKKRADRMADTVVPGTYFAGHLSDDSGLPGRKCCAPYFFYKKLIMTKMLKIPYIVVKK